MTNCAFTPGPWLVSEHSDGRVFRYAKTGEYTSRIETIVRDASDANARLIAAAPELYEALLLWLAYDDQDEADFAEAGPMLLYARAIDATRTTLAKARGES